MLIDPAKVALFLPSGLKKFKLDLFERIGKKIESAGGRTVRGDCAALDILPDDIIPIVGCTPELRPLIDRWQQRKRHWIYWDRGYVDRVFATCLPTGDNGGFYRWHIGSFQMSTIKDVPDDRWRALKASSCVHPWQKNGRHIVIAAPTRTYSRFHRTDGWIADTIDALARVTDRQLVIRDKEQYRRRPIQKDLDGAHALVAHGSIAAVEAVICGCPVFVDHSSAAALVGQTDLSKIEKPVYPERQPWLNALSYSQWDERELTDGTLFRMMT